jgi:hypothetical protein
MVKRSQRILTPAQRIPGFRRGIESVPGHYLVLTPDFTIVSASDVFLRNTMSRRDNIEGRNIFDAFPDNPHDPDASGVFNLKSSFLRVLEHRSLDVVPLLKYDIPKPGYKGGGFEERYWHPVNFPVFDHMGNLVHIIHNSEDVTAQIVKDRQALDKKS